LAYKRRPGSLALLFHFGKFVSKPRALAVGAIERSLQLRLFHLVVPGGYIGTAVDLDDGPAKVGLSLLRHLDLTAQIDAILPCGTSALGR
jgi:hypothetical protein